MFIPLGLIIAALIAGCALLCLECFIPGIGIAGISGAALSIFGIVCLIPYIGWYVVFVIMAIIVMIMLVIYFFANSADKGINPFVLSAKTSKEEGFSANDDNNDLMNKSGVAITDLRPSGIAEIDGKRVDVVTDGAFIKKETKIFVSGIQGRRVIVNEFKGE
ncbi:MAG: hypothetical protein E7365_03480 [Clostridiales bacterium]|nr:hypothetical protein [Clostridiales bacterium]